MKHLHAKHPGESAFLDKEKGSSSSGSYYAGSTVNKQMKLSDCTSSAEPYPPSHFKKKLLDDKVVKMICKDMRPIKMVEDKGFKELMAVADPRYTLPLRKTVSTELLPALYDNTKDIIMAQLKEAEHVAVTTDLWTSLANDSYLSLTTHFISPQWKLISLALSTVRFQGGHTGDNITTHLTAWCRDWSIEDRVRILVSDSAANMLLASRKLPWYHISCFAHQLHLIVAGAIESDSDLKALVTKVKSVVT